MKKLMALTAVVVLLLSFLVGMAPRANAYANLQVCFVSPVYDIRGDLDGWEECCLPPQGGELICKPYEPNGQNGGKTIFVP